METLFTKIPNRYHPSPEVISRPDVSNVVYLTVGEVNKFSVTDSSPANHEY